MGEKVILYSRPHCFKCKVLKQKLEEKGVQFTIIEDISLMKSKNIMQVPMLEVDENIKTYEEALELL